LNVSTWIFLGVEINFSINGLNSTRRTSFQSQNTVAMTFWTELTVMNFLVVGEDMCHHSLFDSGV